MNNPKKGGGDRNEHDAAQHQQPMNIGKTNKKEANSSGTQALSTLEHNSPDGFAASINTVKLIAPIITV